VAGTRRDVFRKASCYPHTRPPVAVRPDGGTREFVIHAAAQSWVRQSSVQGRRTATVSHPPQQGRNSARAVCAEAALGWGTGGCCVVGWWFLVWGAGRLLRRALCKAGGCVFCGGERISTRSVAAEAAVNARRTSFKSSRSVGKPTKRLDTLGKESPVRLTLYGARLVAGARMLLRVVVALTAVWFGGLCRQLRAPRASCAAAGKHVGQIPNGRSLVRRDTVVRNRRHCKANWMCMEERPQRHISHRRHAESPRASHDRTPGSVPQNAGEGDAALATAGQKIEAVY